MTRVLTCVHLSASPRLCELLYVSSLPPSRSISLPLSLSLSLSPACLTDSLPAGLTRTPKCEDELRELLAQQVSTERKQEEAMEKLEARQGPRAPDLCLFECLCACMCVYNLYICVCIYIYTFL